MGILDHVKGPNVYLDANAFIYQFEDFGNLSAAVQPLFDQFDRGALRGVSSEITLGELLVKPLRDAKSAAVTEYVSLFDNPALLHVVPVNRRVILDAAGHRARMATLRLPDALHVASYSAGGCQTFVTNDQRLRNVTGVHALLISDFA